MLLLPPTPFGWEERQEDAGDASGVQGDTLTDRAVLEGKGGEGHTTST